METSTLARLSGFLHFSTAVGFGLCVVAWIGERDLAAQDNWPNWRGPQNNGASLTASPPTQWNASSGILWKSPIDGEGSSTPIVWDQQVILLSAFKTEKTDPESSAQVQFSMDSESRFRSSSSNPEPEAPKTRRVPSVARVVESSDVHSGIRDIGRDDRSGGKRANPYPTNVYKFLVSSFDLRTGAKNWQLPVVEESPHEGGHETNNFASCSPATDGKCIYVFWGSRGIFCLDMQGKMLWSSDLGQKYTRLQFGEGASAALHGNTLIVPWDHESESYLAALNTENGDLKWKTGRSPEKTTWATPVVVEVGDQTQVIMHGRVVRGYDFRDGSLLWECDGQTENPIPTPLVYQQNVIVMSGYRGAACYSISLSSRGTVSSNSDSIRWTYPFNTPYVPSPTLYQDKIYFLYENQALLTCLNAATGKPIYARKKIGELSDIYASVGSADGKIYIVDRTGTTAVVDAGESGEVIATNRVAEDETFDASPVFVNDRLLLRSNKHLYCIGKPN
ncbi:MAG: PQQ-binding-like beta-propeller repeat protein [Pirellula sp.]